MKIALISDIHGNLVSLQAVLEDIDKSHVNQIICLGDVATTGPQPHEVITLLRELKCPNLMGNHEDYLLQTVWIQSRHQSRWGDTLNWCEAQLTEDDFNYLRVSQRYMEVPLDENHKLLCVHGSPRSNNDSMQPTTPDKELTAMLKGITATVIVGGHTHVQMLRRTRETLIVNVGSVGLPFDRYFPVAGEKHILPCAEYGIITWSHAALSVDLRRVPIDFEAVKRATANSDNPYNWMPEWFTPEERPIS